MRASRGLDPGSQSAVLGCSMHECPDEKAGVDVNQRQEASLRTEVARRSLRFRAAHMSAADPPRPADPWSASRASRAPASRPAASRTARRNASDLDTPSRLARSAIALTVAGSSAYVDLIVIVAMPLWYGHTVGLSTISFHHLYPAFDDPSGGNGQPFVQRVHRKGLHRRGRQQPRGEPFCRLTDNAADDSPLKSPA